MPDSRKTADGEPLDIKKAIDRSTQRRALTDLAAEGYNTVRVLDEKQVDELIRKAVDEVVHATTQEHRARIVAEARKQLDKLLKQAKAFKSSAELLQTDKNELVARVENLQKQLEVRQKIEEEAAALLKRLKDSDALVAKLETALDAEQKRAAEVEQGLRAYALLQERYQQGQSEAKKLHSETIKLKTAKSKSEKEVEKLEADLAETKAAAAELEKAKARGEKEIEKLQSDLGAELEKTKAKSDRELEKLQAELEQAHLALAKEKQKSTELAHKSVEAFGHFEESQERLRKLEKETEHAHAEAARLKKELAQAAEAHDAELKKARASTISWKSDKQTIERLEALLAQERGASQELKKLGEQESAAREEADRLGKQLAAAHEELKKIDALEKQLAHERDALKSTRAQLASRERETASLEQSVAKLRKSAKSNAAASAARERLKETEARYEEKLAEARDTSRRLRADAERAKELESRLAREQARARKAQEQLALPRRIDGDLKHLQDKLKETRESGLATRRLAQQVNEAVENVEKLIDRLTKRVPKRP